MSNDWTRAGTEPSGPRPYWSRIILIAALPALTALICLIVGVFLYRKASGVSAPTQLTCKQYLADPGSHDWVAIDECELDFGGALFWQGPDGRTETVYVPMMDPYRLREDAPRVLLRSSDAQLIARAESIMQEFEDFDGDDDEADAWWSENLPRFQPVESVMGTVGTWDAHEADLRRLDTRLGRDVLYLDLGDSPSRSTGMALAFFGLLLGGATYGGVWFLRKVVVHPEPGSAIADVFDEPTADDAAAWRAAVPVGPAGSHMRVPPPPIGVPEQRPTVIADPPDLVVRLGARLPERCIKCNSSRNVTPLKRTLYWHHPALYCVILGGVLIYVIVALIVRKKQVLQVYLCDEHHKRRYYAITGGWGAFVLGCVLFCGGVSNDLPGLLFLALALMIAGTIGGVVLSRVVTPRRIDDFEGRIRGAGPEFLASLPQRR